MPSFAKNMELYQVFPKIMGVWDFSYIIGFKTLENRGESGFWNL
jgi:hypothetical protein